MNAQEVFDTVARHLLTQKAKSVGELSGYCMYRGHNGLKCAAGCLIPDEEYDDSMEGMPIGGLIKHGKAIALFVEHTDLITRLQQIHDWDTPDAWRDRLFHLAGQLGLSDKVLGDPMTYFRYGDTLTICASREGLNEYLSDEPQMNSGCDGTIYEIELSDTTGWEVIE